MRFHLLAVGRARDDAARALFQDYASRLVPPPALREVEIKKRLFPDELKLREGEALLAAVPKGAVVVVLDERGARMDSVALSRWIGKTRDGGAQDAAFLIGGADGHSDEVRSRADLLLSLGAMTWPHMLVRALVAEQLYRSQCLLAGHPYHRA